MLDTLIGEFRQNSAAELIAVILAILYLLLAVREHIACWYAAFASTTIFLFIFFDVRLYMESALQIYYLFMAGYGWWQWRLKVDGKPLAITTWSLKTHLLTISFVLTASVITALVLTEFTDARLPLLDSFTTWGAIVATYMVTRKILENWAYWLVIDGVSIYLYMDRELYFTSLLFAAYIVIIFFGWLSWLRTYRGQRTTAL